GQPHRDVHEAADLLYQPEVAEAVAADGLRGWMQEDRLAELGRHLEERVRLLRVEVLALDARVDDQPDEPAVADRLSRVLEQLVAAERIGVGVGGQARRVLPDGL